MEIFLGWIIFSLAVGAIGINRNIGFAGAFFLSLFLSPIIGLIFTLVSKSDEQLKFETELLSHAKKQTDGILNVGHKSFTDELFKLKNLLDSDLITREEFEIEKENLKSSLLQKKTVLSLYCSSTTGISGRLMIRVGDKGNFIDLPQGRDNALDFDVHAGEVKVVISPTGIFASEKMVYLKTVMHETTLYDISEIYTQ
ncbi:SHOCT domain-containing protein [Sphingobacterium sp.]|uniref:SHOCT domain-containing protein n=1 Tax=Sphingobacterium sp. TaxID=341027 RepID=UPI0031E3823E